MKLLLPLPERWRQRRLRDGVLLVAPEENLELFVTKLTGVDADPEAWMQWALTKRGAEPPRNLQSTSFKTESGWVAMVLSADVGDEARLVAYYLFFDYAAAVIAACKAPAARPRWRDEVVALLVRAKPDFTQRGVISLSHQLGGPPPLAATRPIDDGGALTRWRRISSGGDLFLRPNEPFHSGSIRISRRITPIVPVAEICARLQERAGPGAQLDGPAIMVTAEGEYAMFATAVTERQQLCLGAVFGDEFFSEILGATTAPAQFAGLAAAARNLTYGFTLGLGNFRWRRFYYEAPPGWSGIGRSWDSFWISPRCPLEYQVMRVFAARPVAENRRARQGARLFETLGHEFFEEPRKGPITFHTPQGLSCEVTVFTGKAPNRAGTIKAIEGTVTERGYLYPVRMECDDALLEETLRAFEKVIESIRLLPELGQDLDADLGALTSWSD